MVRMAWTGDPAATGLHGTAGHTMRPKGFWPAGGSLGGTWTGLQAAVRACGDSCPPVCSASLALWGAALLMGALTSMKGPLRERLIRQQGQNWPLGETLTNSGAPQGFAAVAQMTAGARNAQNLFSALQVLGVRLCERKVAREAIRGRRGGRLRAFMRLLARCMACAAESFEQCLGLGKALVGLPSWVDLSDQPDLQKNCNTLDLKAM